MDILQQQQQHDVQDDEFTFVPDLHQDEEVVYKFIEGLTQIQKEQLALKFIKEMTDPSGDDEEEFGERMEDIEDSILKDISKSKRESFGSTTSEEESDIDNGSIIATQEDWNLDDIEKLSDEMLSNLDKFMLEIQQQSEDDPQQKSLSLAMAGKVLMKLAKSKRKVAVVAASSTNATTSSEDDNKLSHNAETTTTTSTSTSQPPFPLPDSAFEAGQEEEEDVNKPTISLRTVGNLVLAMSRAQQNRLKKQQRNSLLSSDSFSSQHSSSLLGGGSGGGGDSSGNPDENIIKNSVTTDDDNLILPSSSSSEELRHQEHQKDLQKCLPRYSSPVRRRLSTHRTSIGLISKQDLLDDDDDDDDDEEEENSSKRQTQKDLMALLPRYWGSTSESNDSDDDDDADINDDDDYDDVVVDMPSLTRKQSQQVQEEINNTLSLKAAGMVFLAIAKMKEGNKNGNNDNDEPTKEQTDFVAEIVRKQKALSSKKKKKKSSSPLWKFFSGIFDDDNLSEELKGNPSERLHAKIDKGSGKIVSVVAETSGYRVVAK